MKKIMTRIAAVIAAAVLITGIAPVFDVQAKRKVRAVKTTGDFIYTVINAPSTFMGKKITYQGLEAGTGRIIVQYGEAGDGIKVVLINSKSSVRPKNIDGPLLEYRSEHDVSIDDNVNVTEIVDPDNEAGSDLYDLVPGKINYSYVLAIEDSKDSDRYGLVTWERFDYTDYEDREDGEPWEIDLTTATDYVDIFAVFFDDPISEKDFKEVYELTKQLYTTTK